MINALIKLNQQNLNHLDLKPCNILLSEISENNYKVKLSDFGTSRVSKNTVTNTSAKGTSYYMSPEMVLI